MIVPIRIASLCLLLASYSVACASYAPVSMSRDRMESIIADSSAEVEGSPGAIQFTIEGVEMFCISDLDHDRMRLVAPIAPRDEVDDRKLELMLIANFHSSLDARYAVSRGVVVAAFLHPMSTLTEGQLESALYQVASLVRTFGSTYSSGELVFGARQGQPL